MWKKILVLSLLIGGLPFSTYAATIDPYVRTPSGTPIVEQSVEIDYSATDFAVGTTYYKFNVSVDHSPYTYTSGCLSISGGTVTDSLTIPAAPGEYSNVRINEYTDSSCIINNGTTNVDDPFTVTSAAATTTVATTTDEMTREDQLFLWGVSIFFLSFLIWGRIFRL